MSAKPKTLILRTAGTNCDVETAHAFGLAGGEAQLVHINRIVAEETKLSDYQIIAIPGGFTYGDDIASGKILANELMCKLGDELKKFVADGKLIIGICNGFQVLVKSGLLPALDASRFTLHASRIQATLTLNDSAKFEDRWTYLRNAESKCVWTQDLPEMIYLPVAHGEGKFAPKDDKALKQLRDNGQVVFQYVDENGEFAGYPANPNGSIDSIAGICDPTGKIFGLMPHPERHVHFTQHPHWTRDKKGDSPLFSDGLQIFKNAVEYAKNNL